MLPAGPHGPPPAHRRRGSPQAVGGRLGVSRRPVAARADCPFGGRCKLVVSSAPVRQLAPRTQPARAPNQPGTSHTQPARSPASPSACVRVPAPRAPAGFGSPRPTPPAPPPAPPASPDGRWRTTVTLTARRHDGPPPPPSSVHLHRRHPRHRLYRPSCTRSRYTLAAVLSPRGRRLRL